MFHDKFITYSWQFLSPYENSRPFTTIQGNKWQYMTFHGYSWPFMTDHYHSLLLIVNHNNSWQFLTLSPLSNLSKEMVSIAGKWFWYLKTELLHCVFSVNLIHLACPTIFQIVSLDTISKTIVMACKIKHGGKAGFQHLIMLHNTIFSRVTVLSHIS